MMKHLSLLKGMLAVGSILSVLNFSALSAHEDAIDCHRGHHHHHHKKCDAHLYGGFTAYFPTRAVGVITFVPGDSIPFASPSFNNGIIADASFKNFTVPKGGTYQITYGAALSDMELVFELGGFALYVNGQPALNGYVAVPVNNRLSTDTQILNLNQGDVISVRWVATDRPPVAGLLWDVIAVNNQPVVSGNLIIEQIR